MKNSNLLKALKSINEKIEELEAQAGEIRAKIKEANGIKKGDRVKVIQIYWNGKEEEIGFGYIENVTVYKDGDVHYRILKEKTDGTPSAINYSKWDKFRVEKIN